MNNDMTEFFIKDQLTKLQELEELGGPDTMEQYLAVMTALRKEIDKRIQTVLEQSWR